MRTTTLLATVSLSVWITTQTLGAEEIWRRWAQQFDSVQCLEVVAYSVVEGVVPPQPPLGQATVPEGTPPWSMYEIEHWMVCRDGKGSLVAWVCNGTPASEQSQSEFVLDVFNRKPPSLSKRSGLWQEGRGGRLTILKGGVKFFQFPPGHDWTWWPVSSECEAVLSRAFLEGASDVTETIDPQGATVTASFGSRQLRVRLEPRGEAWHMVWNEHPVAADGKAMVRTEFLDFARIEGYPTEFPMRWRTLSRKRADVEGIEVKQVGEFWTNRVRHVILCSPTLESHIPPSAFRPDASDLRNVELVTAPMKENQQSSQGQSPDPSTPTQARPSKIRKAEKPVPAITYRLLGIGGLLVGAGLLVWSRMRK